VVPQGRIDGAGPFPIHDEVQIVRYLVAADRMQDAPDGALLQRVGALDAQAWRQLPGGHAHLMPEQRRDTRKLLSIAHRDQAQFFALVICRPPSPLPKRTQKGCRGYAVRPERFPFIA
jgi:hypothetical protein